VARRFISERAKFARPSAFEMARLALSQSGMEITGIASQFAMQSRPICDASSNMRHNNCDALLGYRIIGLQFILT